MALIHLEPTCAFVAGPDHSPYNSARRPRTVSKDNQTRAQTDPEEGPQVPQEGGHNPKEGGTKEDRGRRVSVDSSACQRRALLAEWSQRASTIPSSRAHSRRWGIGSRLMTAALDFLKTRGTRKVWVTVSSINTPAVIYYMKNGFIPRGGSQEPFRRWNRRGMHGHVLGKIRSLRSEILIVTTVQFLFQA